ncbi:MAG: peroxiredoxin [Pseudanabaenaceae cyanobacterium bins.68]|nr:peroxiredoxin [Pseudanabaenaceae cyanobacterium bins.68]
MAVKIGDLAPDFTLPTPAGGSVTLSSFRGQKAVVIYFYPKDDSPGCTIESCAFRDRYQVFQDLGAEVIGISADSVNSHTQFATKHRLPFILASDTNNQVRNLFGVPNTLWVMPGRVTYVIDREGIVRQIFDSMLDFQGHVDQALKILGA